MKTNIAGLMLLIKELEEKNNLLSSVILEHVVNKTIIELSGKENIIEDYKIDFQNELMDYQITLDRITYLKRILYEKNNEFKLKDGRSIQTALVDNANLRKFKSLIEQLLLKKNSKVRITEVNNSYFESSTVNYDIDELKKKNKELEDKIFQTDFEISKLNSIEFEINK